MKQLKDVMSEDSHLAFMSVEIPYRYLAVRNDWRDAPDRWEVIRSHWEVAEHEILAGRRINPYWLNWDFTPIERELWNDIRGKGLPFYPQIPVGPYFLDFGDPTPAERFAQCVASIG